jgi:hypothetical protein
MHVKKHEVAPCSLGLLGHVGEAELVELPVVELRDFLSLLTRSPAVDQLRQVLEVAADCPQIVGVAAIGVECGQQLAELTDRRCTSECVV